jgi:hypothetical protein
MEVNGQLHTLVVLPPGDGAAGTHRIGVWVGPRADLDFMEKRKISFPWPRIEKQAVSIPAPLHNDAFLYVCPYIGKASLLKTGFILLYGVWGRSKSDDPEVNLKTFVVFPPFVQHNGRAGTQRH